MENKVIQIALRDKGTLIMMEVSYIIIPNRNLGRVTFALCFLDEGSKPEGAGGEKFLGEGCSMLILSYVGNRFP